MKINIEIDPLMDDYEVTIKCARVDETVAHLQRLLSDSVGANSGQMAFYRNDTEYFMQLDSILFFETSEGTIYAHTLKEEFEVKYKLYELEGLLPSYFMRISKSTILNTHKVYAISKNITGASKVEFQGTEKIVYVSRNYYKALIGNLLPERK